MGPLGFEPRTPGLKVRSSAAELRARVQNRSGARLLLLAPGLGAAHGLAAPLGAGGVADETVEVILDRGNADPGGLQLLARTARVVVDVHREVREEHLAALQPTAHRLAAAA